MHSQSDNDKRIMTDKTQLRLNELESIIVREQDMLFRFAYMRVGRRADAEDIVQDVFLKLFRSSDSLKSVRNVKHYLIRSISNACRDFHRRKQDILPLEKAEREMVSDDDLKMYEEYLRITELAGTLPQEQKEVLYMKCIDGLKFREIADILELPEATIKSRYRYAIQGIQKQLN